MSDLGKCPTCGRSNLYPVLIRGKIVEVVDGRCADVLIGGEVLRLDYVPVLNLEPGMEVIVHRTEHQDVYVADARTESADA